MSKNEISDLRDTIVPKSDQLNADQLLGGPITITVTDVRRGTADQPITIHYDGEGGRPFKPCKTVRKILVHAWGADGNAWIGRRMTLFNRPDVKWGGEEVGGIRVSHLSHIPSPMEVSLAETRSVKKKSRIEKLGEQSTPEDSRARLEAAARGGTSDLAAAWRATPTEHKLALGGADGCPEQFKALAREADAREAALRQQASQAGAQPQDDDDAAGDWPTDDPAAPNDPEPRDDHPPA